ncbi:unnamed protein product, partial [marine sediment metagenome]
HGIRGKPAGPRVVLQILTKPTDLELDAERQRVQANRTARKKIVDNRTFPPTITTES